METIKAKIDTTAHNSGTVQFTQVYIATIYDLFKYAVALRKTKQLTQKQLAKEMGCSASRVSFAERNPESVSLDYWYIFAKLWGIEMSVPTFSCLTK